MPVKNKLAVAKQALATLRNDREEILVRVDEYERGIQDDPYMPDTADAEYMMLAERAKTNVVGFVVSSTAQGMYVDSFRKGTAEAAVDGPTKPLEARTEALTPEWKHWQRSRLDARQAAIYRGALKFGHAFVLTEKNADGEVVSYGLSALRTSALFENPAVDDDAIAVLHVKRWATKDKLGLARMWDDTYEYEVKFKNFHDLKNGVVVKQLKAHGAKVCPVTRFTAAVDLEGRTIGVVEPMIPLQDRINQTIFDLLVVQSYASFKVRTISGMAPPVKMKAVDAEGNEVLHPELNEDKIVDWQPVLDPRTGRPMPEDINLSAKRVFWGVDPEARFGTLDETPLDGFISAIGMAFQHMAALSQTPPHHLLGQIANLSAEALNAAESALQRKIDEFRNSFGESWERVFRVAAQIGDYDGADNYAGEVIWRDMQAKSLAQAGDALGKMHDLLGVPQRGLWRRIPGVTANELATWEQMWEQENAEIKLAETPAPASGRPAFRLTTPEAENE